MIVYGPIKRMLDVSAALALAVLFAPALAVIAMAVRLSSPGPVIYRGVRTGRGGVPFRIWKFRTMKVDSERLGTTTGLNDPRVTWVGKHLRRYKLDELPQLGNVLRGEMSFVGPRPEMPEHTAEYSAEEMLILSVRPGITDFASLRFADLAAHVGTDDPHGEYVRSVRGEKNRLRLEYVRRRSLMVDAEIAVRTAELFLSRMVGRRR